MRILYVCPFAHHSGHPPSVAIREPDALARAGADVTLLTFYGIIDKTKVDVPHITVIPCTRFIYRLEVLISHSFMRWYLSRWVIEFLANMWTIAQAMWVRRKIKYDVIYLRDGDPFLFIPIIFSSLFRNYNWVIALMGSGLPLNTPSSLLAFLKEGIYLFVYRLILKCLSNKLWKPIYRHSFARNNFIFISQTELVKQKYESYLGGILAGKVKYITMGYWNSTIPVSKEDARRYLDLPQDKVLFLSFGASHLGKNLEIVFCAIKDIPNTLLVQAGKYEDSIGKKPSNLARYYNVESQAIIRKAYIPDSEKPYYFFAADAIILSYTKQFLSTASLLWEACYFRTPVIASDDGQLGQLVKELEVGLLFVPEDANSLREAILRFINTESQKVEQFRDNCHRLNDEWSMDRWARGFLRICQEASE